MEPRHLAAFDRLERQKEEVLRRLAGWPAARLARRPGEESWSALEVLDHLQKTETAVRLSCEKNLKAPQRRVTRADRARAVFFLSLMRLPIRVAVPQAVSFLLPERPASLAAVLEAWATERRELRAFLEALAPGGEAIGVVRHPVAGWVDLRGALAFLSVHLRHHDFQIRRIGAALRG